MLTLKKSIGATLLGATLALAALGGFVGSAQARTYPGVFTPPFGEPFADLEWSGSGDFTIPDACEAQPTGWHANYGICSGMSITNATSRSSKSNTAASLWLTLAGP